MQQAFRLHCKKQNVHTTVMIWHYGSANHMRLNKTNWHSSVSNNAPHLHSVFIAKNLKTV